MYDFIIYSFIVMSVEYLSVLVGELSSQQSHASVSVVLRLGRQAAAERTKEEE